MTVCEMVWTPQRAREVSSMVERATGEPCPCKVGRACPFVRLEMPESEQEPALAR